MGNQVLIAIRHDVSRSEIPAFSEQDIMGLHDPEHTPKNFKTHNGIIVSNYHHSADKICLVTNNDFMVNIPVHLDIFHKTRDGAPFSAIKDTVSNYRRYRYKSIPKSNKKKDEHAANGVKVSLFGYLTDQTYDMPENSFELMVQSLDSVPVLINGVVSHRGWEDHIGRTPIVKIGTIESNQLAFVELYGNLFSVVSEQRHQMAELEHKENRKEKTLDFDIKFLSSLGYNLKPAENEPRWF